MFEIIVVTHGELAEGIKKFASLFFGDSAKKIHAVHLLEGESLSCLNNKISRIINTYQEHSSFLVLVDIYNGTPSNSCAVLIDTLKEKYNFQCITGFNMPLLLEVLGMQSDTPLDDAYQVLMTRVSDSIIDLRKRLEI